jgi:pimeloyl-ACP methyl ester carboxylesterase
LLLHDEFTAGARVRDACAVMEALGIEGALIVGHSMGAVTAIQLAARHRSLVRAVILIDPPLTGDESDVERDSAFSFEAWVNEVVEMRSEALADVCRRDNPGWTAEEIDAWVVSKQEMDRDLFRRPQSRHDGPWRAAMEAISCPALVVAGRIELGSLIDEGAGRWLGDAPNVEFVRIEGAGHSVHRDARERFASVVEAFLDGR